MMTNKIEVTAKCLAVGQVQTVGQNGFRKRDLVLHDDSGKYPQLLAFTLKKDNVDRVNSQMVGHTLKVTGYVESREWNGRYFTEVTAVKVEDQEMAEAVGSGAPAPAEPNETVDYGEVADDMPF